MNDTEKATLTKIVSPDSREYERLVARERWTKADTDRAVDTLVSRLGLQLTEGQYRQVWMDLYRLFHAELDGSVIRQVR